MHVARRAAPPFVDLHAPGNRLLSAIPPTELAGLLRYCDYVNLQSETVLYEPGKTIDSVFFLVTAMVSELVVMADGTTVEIGNVGSEGIVGISLAMQQTRSAFQSTVKLPGSAWQISGSALMEQFQAGGRLTVLLRRYGYARLVQAAQTAACHLHHSVKQRLARWLLQAYDHMDGRSFPLTHELLSQVLGAQRSTVTLAACALERAGFIRYKHGQITVVDRQKLEASVCECYWVVRRHLENVFELP